MLELDSDDTEALVEEQLWLLLDSDDVDVLDVLVVELVDVVDVVVLADDGDETDDTEDGLLDDETEDGLLGLDGEEGVDSDVIERDELDWLDQPLSDDVDAELGVDMEELELVDEVDDVLLVLLLLDGDDRVLRLDGELGLLGLDGDDRLLLLDWLEGDDSVDDWLDSVSLCVEHDSVTDVQLEDFDRQLSLLGLDEDCDVQLVELLLDEEEELL